MYDQADELRQLVLRAAAESLVTEAPAPPLIVVTGGKGGVGATTIAVNLAIVLASQGQRSVLVDADLNQPDASLMCRTEGSDSIVDVLQGRRTLHEVLQRGPAGIQVLPGSWAEKDLQQSTPAAENRVFSALKRLGAHADVVIVDAGSGKTAEALRFGRAADLLLVVTSDEPSAIMDSYASIKRLASEAVPQVVGCVVNKVMTQLTADEVSERIQTACSRFLGLQIHSLPFVSLDPGVPASQDRKPIVLADPMADATVSIEKLSAQLNEILSSIRKENQSSGTPRQDRNIAA